MDDYDQENRTYSEDKVLSRKSKKPLMEKRRRQRINNCLTQLKSLVLQAMKKDTTHYSKLEKADILEMTVKYLRSLQRRQITSAAVADPSVAAKYAVGFHECASEVARYLGNAQGINEDVRGRLLGHLTNCVQGSNTQQQIPQCQTYMQPLHVQIPSSQNGHGLSQVTSDSLLLPQQNEFIQSVSRTNSIPSSGMQLSGTFRVVQDNVYNGSTSLYPGRSNDVRVLEQKMIMQPCSLPTQRSNSESGRQQLQPKMCKSDDSYMITESGRRISTVNESKMHLPGLSSSPGYASASSALKEERLWRPW